MATNPNIDLGHPCDCRVSMTNDSETCGAVPTLKHGDYWYCEKHHPTHFRAWSTGGWGYMREIVNPTS
jgi:hypothetical protein